MDSSQSTINDSISTRSRIGRQNNYGQNSSIIQVSRPFKKQSQVTLSTENLLDNMEQDSSTQGSAMKEKINNLFGDDKDEVNSENG